MISLFWWGVIFAAISLTLTVIFSGTIVSRIKYREGIVIAGIVINFLALLTCFGTGGELDKFGLGIVVVWIGLYLAVWVISAVREVRERRK